MSFFGSWLPYTFSAEAIRSKEMLYVSRFSSNLLPFLIIFTFIFEHKAQEAEYRCFRSSYLSSDFSEGRTVLKLIHPSCHPRDPHPMLISASSRSHRAFLIFMAPVADCHFVHVPSVFITHALADNAPSGHEWWKSGIVWGSSERNVTFVRWLGNRIAQQPRKLWVETDNWPKLWHINITFFSLSKLRIAIPEEVCVYVSTRHKAMKDFFGFIIRRTHSHLPSPPRSSLTHFISYKKNSYRTTHTTTLNTMKRFIKIVVPSKMM